jgi:non-heme chloroperoxidase
MLRRSLLTVLLVVGAAGVARPAGAWPFHRGSGTVRTPDGVKIHYLRKGEGAAILFVPGWTMPAEIWRPQLEYFGKAWQAVAIDPRSQGDSSKPADGNYPAVRARDIRAVADRLHLSPVTLVGWSMGVREVVAYVDQFGTAGVSRVVLVDGGVGNDGDPDLLRGMVKFLAAVQEQRAAVTRDFVRAMFKRPQSEAYLARLTAAAMKTPTASAVASYLGWFASDYRPALAKIDKPAMIVVSGATTQMSVYQDMQRRIPNARLEVLDGTGHALFVDDAPRFNALLEGFLRGR